MDMDHKIILTDIDGVIFNWHKAFVNWMEMQGYESTGITHHDADIHLEFGMNFNDCLVKKDEFNCDMIASTLEPYADAHIWINKLYNEGWRFIGITSFSDKPIAQYYRYLNLEDYFPTDAFGTMIFLTPGETKREVLSQFQGTELFYIEDRIININNAKRLGLTPVLMKHDYNMHFGRDDVKVVENWEQTYNYINEQFAQRIIDRTKPPSDHTNK